MTWPRCSTGPQASGSPLLVVPLARGHQRTGYPTVAWCGLEPWELRGCGTPYPDLLEAFLGLLPPRCPAPVGPALSRRAPSRYGETAPGSCGTPALLRPLCLLPAGQRRATAAPDNTSRAVPYSLRSPEC